MTLNILARYAKKNIYFKRIERKIRRGWRRHALGWEWKRDSIEPKSGEGWARLKKEGVDERLLENDISFALTIDVHVIISRQRWMIGNSKFVWCFVGWQCWGTKVGMWGEVVVILWWKNNETRNNVVTQ